MMQAVHKVQTLIVGAGPIGLELGICLQRLGHDFVIIEAGQIAQTIAGYPKHTRFFSTTERLGIAGIPLHTADQQRATGEQYVHYLHQLAEGYDLPVRTFERVEQVAKQGEGFAVRTKRLQGSQHAYHCRHLVLALGDMSFDNRLGIPGEELPHVLHRMDDPQRYLGSRMLIVGGKNSAVEAALRCYHAGAKVAIAYRRADFMQERVKPWLLPELRTLIGKGQVQFLPSSQPVEVNTDGVVLQRLDGELQPSDEEFVQAADFVFLATGFQPDRRLFTQLGVALEDKEQRPVLHPETMEASVPGVYVIGTATAGKQYRYRVFIETSHVHVAKVVRALTGQEAVVGGYGGRNYFFELEAALREGGQP